MKLFEELKRRKVFRVGIAYLTLSWLLVQIAETLLPAYGFTDFAMRVLVAVLALGFAISLVLAWLFDWTRSGFQKTGAAGDSIADPSDKTPNVVIAAIVVIAAVAAGTLTFRTLTEAPTSGQSIAVMPFHTLGQSQADVFTDGIHVGVNTRLASVADLNVISRTSVLSYRDKTLPLPQIAAELGASWVLNGDVQQAGDEVLVSVRLSDATADRQVWARDYRRLLTATNIFEIQADVVNRIIDEVNVQLSAAEQTRIDRLPTSNLEAYNLYQHGRALLEQRNREAMFNSLDYFERAIEQDSEYAEACGGLANALVLIVAYELDDDPIYLDRAKEALQRARYLDDQLADVWVSEGLLRYWQHDVPGAIEAMELAIQNQPSNANAHSQLAFQFALAGDLDSAYFHATRAVQLNPLSPEALSVLAGTTGALGRIEESLDAARRALELAPGWPNTRFGMGMALVRAGNYEAAIEQLKGVTVRWTGAGAETMLLQAFVGAGRENEALELLPRIEESGDQYAMAASKAILGDLDGGYEILMELDEWGDFQTLVFQGRHRSLWNSSGADPRYDEVLRRVHDFWGISTPEED